MGGGMRPCATTAATGAAPGPAPGCGLLLLAMRDYKRLENTYKLLKKVGKGSAGDVYLATHRESSQRVAIKIMSVEKLRRTGVQEAALLREMDAMKTLQHKNIVRFVDALQTNRLVPEVSEQPPFVCIAMEYLENFKPLSFFIRKWGSQPSLAKAVMPQLAEALAAMHASGYVHRDIWSENVLVDPNRQIKLIDLGCACKFTEDEPNVENRMNLPYMSPQASQWGRQQPGDDCWATGCLLLEMTSGRFLADAMGRSDRPLHQRKEVMEKMLEDSVKVDQVLAEIASQLLDMNASTRMPMKELLVRITGAA